MINDSILEQCDRPQEGGIKLVLHYQGLKIQELLGYKNLD